jgi:hypothetical protein
LSFVFKKTNFTRQTVATTILLLFGYLGIVGTGQGHLLKSANPQILADAHQDSWNRF